MTTKRDWRNSKEYRQWRALVIRRDKVCQCCSTIKNRHAHHINHATFNVSDRFNVDNGITLCKNCHSILHNSIVGNYRKKCTKSHLDNLLELRDYFKGL